MTDEEERPPDPQLRRDGLALMIAIATRGMKLVAELDEWGREIDEYGRIKDAAERYQQFMLGLFDLLAEAGDDGYSPQACERLAEARLLFIEEFERRHPGYGKGRAVWP